MYKKTRTEPRAVTPTFPRQLTQGLPCRPSRAKGLSGKDVPPGSDPAHVGPHVLPPPAPCVPSEGAAEGGCVSPAPSWTEQRRPACSPPTVERGRFQLSCSPLRSRGTSRFGPELLFPEPTHSSHRGQERAWATTVHLLGQWQKEKPRWVHMQRPTTSPPQGRQHGGSRRLSWGLGHSSVCPALSPGVPALALFPGRL